jgi:glycosyltransferase involved in cell wall biosynthesis
MKVLHISHSDTGGAGRACIRLHQALLQAGVESKVLVLNQHNFATPFIYSYKKLLKSKLRHFCEMVMTFLIENLLYLLIKNKPKSSDGFDFPLSSYRLCNLSLVKEADIINLHWVSFFLDIPSFFKTVKKPIVWTMHDMQPFTGGNHYQTDFKAESYIFFNNLIIKLKSQHLKSNLIFVAPSKWLQNEFKKSQFANFRQTQILNSVNTLIFKVIEQKLWLKNLFGVSENKKIILFIADNLNNKRKGVSFVMECIDLLSIDDFEWICVGKPSEMLMQKPNVKYLGYFTDEITISIIYNLADVFVMPSLEDNLPNTIIESLCCGVPVVGFNHTGIREMISVDGFGVLAEDISSKSLSKAILRIYELQINEKRSLISNKAHQIYHPNIQSSAYKDIYYNLLDQ